MIQDVGPFLLSPDTPLEEALRRLHVQGGDLGLVLDRRDRLVGLVRDVDLRRAIAHGAAPSEAVVQHLVRGATTVGAGEPWARVRARLLSSGYRSLPVTRGRRVVGAATFEGGGTVPAGQAVAVLMAGGRGARLRPLTDRVPKPLLSIGGKTVVERLLRRVAAAGIREAFLAVRYRALTFEKLLGNGRALGVRLQYLRERSSLGTAGALSLIRRPLRGPFLVVNADVVTSLDFSHLLEYHRRHRGAVTVSVVAHSFTLPFGVVRSRQGRFEAMEEKPTLTVPCNAGMYVIEPQVLRLLPRDTALSMPELLVRVREARLPVHVFPVLESWIDIGSPEDLRRAEEACRIGEA